MTTNDITFDDSALKKVLQCSVLLASLDGMIPENELEKIQRFGQSLWRDEFGDLDAFFKEILYEANRIVTDVAKVIELLDALVDDLSNQLSGEQKEIMLGLLQSVMPTGYAMGSEEAYFFIGFLNRLQEENAGKGEYAFPG